MKSAITNAVLQAADGATREWAGGRAGDVEATVEGAMEKAKARKASINLTIGNADGDYRSVKLDGESIGYMSRRYDATKGADVFGFVSTHPEIDYLSADSWEGVEALLRDAIKATRDTRPPRLEVEEHGADRAWVYVIDRASRTWIGGIERTTRYDYNDRARKVWVFEPRYEATKAPPAYRKTDKVYPNLDDAEARSKAALLAKIEEMVGITPRKLAPKAREVRAEARAGLQHGPVDVAAVFAPELSNLQAIADAGPAGLGGHEDYRTPAGFWDLMYAQLATPRGGPWTLTDAGRAALDSGFPFALKLGEERGIPTLNVTGPDGGPLLDVPQEGVPFLIGLAAARVFQMTPSQRKGLTGLLGRIVEDSGYIGRGEPRLADFDGLDISLIGDRAISLYARGVASPDNRGKPGRFFNEHRYHYFVSQKGGISAIGDGGKMIAGKEAFWAGRDYFGKSSGKAKKTKSKGGE